MSGRKESSADTKGVHGIPTMDKKLVKRVVTQIGYRKANWAELSIGDEVYLLGVREGNKWAYGPYMVQDPDNKMLITPDGSEHKSRAITVLIRT